MLGDRFDGVLQGARDGDVQAFAELWRETQPMLLRYLRVSSDGHAEDVASQTWVDELRRSGRRPEDLVADPGLLDQQPTAPDPAVVAQGRMSTQTALHLVATLPPDQAEMITLRVLVGMNVPEVAALVGKSPGAVRVAVHRGYAGCGSSWTRPHR